MTSPSYSTFSIAPIGDSEHAARLTVSQPPLNLVNAKFLTDMHDYLKSLQKRPDTARKVLVVSSADKHVCISHLDLHISTSLPTVFIAEVNGLAVGGGVGSAVNMDMRFGGPRFGVPEVAGSIVHGGGLQALTKLIEPGRAMEFMLSSSAVDHKEAEKLGLVNRATDNESCLRKFVDDLATRITVFPRCGIEGTKQGVRECLDGQGSMQINMQRLGKLAHTVEAQKVVSDVIERGEHNKTKNALELGLPDTCMDV
ncbi:hypothetical protein LTR97_011206 [Elasticomyces elasticus]|uniref:Enoyl-CoA hydratase n=1 Tax=Elasticomyces elasticus TaxID=574655 RepID=A0AAN7VYT7_9PEZI|nr:hypothetical protein LTR97_011206 [Elasticomyces elasticus]